MVRLCLDLQIESEAWRLMMDYRWIVGAVDEEIRWGGVTSLHRCGLLIEDRVNGSPSSGPAD